MAKKKFVQNNNNNAICYYRYSSSAQRDVSINQQQEQAMEYAKKHGLHIIKEYADRAISGSTDERPQFQQMLVEVETIRPAYLILWKTDRLSRDRVDAVIAKQRLRDCGCQICYVAESMPEDEAERVLIEGIEEALAEHFLIQHRKNVTRGLTDNAKKALYNGRQIFGYIGKVNCRYELDVNTAPIVKRIFQQYADGKRMQEIINELNDSGIRSSRGNKFTVNSLRHILQNRAYIGEYRWNEILIADGFPQIIDEELFDKVQMRMTENKRGGRPRISTCEDKSEFWLTGHLYCGECGATISGTSGTSKQGNRHYYYCCMNHKKRGDDRCIKKNIRQEKLEAIILEMLQEMMNDATLKMRIANTVFQYHQQRVEQDIDYADVLQKEIHSIDIQLQNFVKAISKGIFNETTQNAMRDLEQRKQALQDELAVESNKIKYSLKPEHVLKYLEAFVDSLDEVESRKRLLEYLVDKIYVFEDKIVAVCYYSNDTREFMFDDIERLLENRKSIMNILDSIPPKHNKKVEEQLNVMLESMLEPNMDFFA